MKAEGIWRSAAVLLGIVAGYVVWLAGITALTVVVPTQYMIAAAGVFLGVIVLISLALARHFRQSDRRSVALACWCAPALPIVASVYSLVVFLS
jgi:hypothetical protein